VSLVAVPAHVALGGRQRQMIRVENGGTQRAIVDVTRAGFALDLRGRPRVRPAASRPAASWLVVSPRRGVIPPGQSRALSVSARLGARAEPGDHEALVLLTSRPRHTGAVFVRIRLGVVVVVRAPGKVVRRLTPLRLRVRRTGHRRLLELLVANRGNVTEALSPGCPVITLHRGGRVLARLAPTPRQFLPRTRGIAEIRYRGRLRGAITARVERIARGGCAPMVPRAFRIRL
jgi:hypothetical protein